MSDTITTADGRTISLSELREKAEAATPGPLSCSLSRGRPGHGFEAQVWDAQGKALLFMADDREIGPEADATVAHIAAYDRETCLALVDEIRRLRERVAAAKKALGITLLFREFMDEWHNTQNAEVVEFRRLREIALKGNP